MACAIATDHSPARCSSRSSFADQVNVESKGEDCCWFAQHFDGLRVMRSPFTNWRGTGPLGYTVSDVGPIGKESDLALLVATRKDFVGFDATVTDCEGLCVPRASSPPPTKVTIVATPR